MQRSGFATILTPFYADVARKKHSVLTPQQARQLKGLLYLRCNSMLREHKARAPNWTVLEPCKIQPAISLPQNGKNM